MGKSNGGMGGLYRSAHEMVVVFKHGRAGHRNNVQLGRYGRNRTNVWNYPGSSAFARGEEADLTSQHPTPKPVAMIADAILDVTARGELVLDPFLGSGSTMIAAERVGRTCGGIEVDPLYVDLTIRRWQRLTGEQAIREDGATFDSLTTNTSEGIAR
jgi:DNA modification methylase